MNHRCPQGLSDTRWCEHDLHWDFSARRKPRGLVTDAPCRATCPNQLTPIRFSNTKSPFHVRRANAAVFQARSAFRQRIPLTHGPCWRLDRGRLGRHWCLGFAASTQLPTRVHPQVLRARPNHHPAFTGAQGPRAVRQLLQCP